MELNNEPEMQDSLPTPETPPVPETASPAAGGYDALYQHTSVQTPKPPKKTFREKFRAWIRNTPVPAGFWMIALYCILELLFEVPALFFPEGAAQSIATEVFGFIPPFLLLWYSGYTDSLRFNAGKLGRTLLIALPLLIFGGLGVLWELVNTPAGAVIQWQSAPVIFAGFLKLLRIAVTEIMIFFGITARSIGEKNGTDQEGVWYSALVSGFIFGLFAFLNAFLTADFSEAVGLGISGAVMGAVYAAVWYRGGSLYPVMLLHFLYAAAQNFSACFIQGTDAAVSILSEYSSGNYVMAVAGFLLIGFLLRRKKIREAVENLCGKEAADLLPGNMTRAERRQAKRERVERRRRQSENHLARIGQKRCRPQRHRGAFPDGHRGRRNHQCPPPRQGIRHMVDLHLHGRRQSGGYGGKRPFGYRPCADP